MQPNALKTEKKVRSWAIKGDKILLLSLVLLCLILATTNLVKKDVIRTHLVPPDIPKAMWVEQDVASDTYYQQMAMFIQQLIFNVTPSSVEFNAGVLKQYVCAGNYAVFDARVRESALRMKREGATTLFSPRLVTVDRVAKLVYSSGESSTFVQDRRTALTQNTYAAQFEMANGRFCLKDLYETDAQRRRLEPAADSASNASGSSTPTTGAGAKQ